MALQSSGSISISQIKAELSNSSSSLRTLSAAASKSIPDGMQEFYGYTGAPTYNYNSSMSIGSGQYYYSVAYGWSSITNKHPYGNFGYLGTATINGTGIDALFWHGGANKIYMYNTIAHPSWTTMVIDGVNFGSSTSWTTVTSTLRTYATSTNPFGTSGTININIIY